MSILGRNLPENCVRTYPAPDLSLAKRAGHASCRARFLRETVGHYGASTLEMASTSLHPSLLVDGDAVLLTATSLAVIVTGPPAN